MGQEQSQIARGGQGNNRLPEGNSEQLRRDAAATRSEMDETIDALMARLNPGRLLSQAVESLMSGGSGAGRRGRQAGGAAANVGGQLMHKIRDNPVPAAMVAAGAAWLLMSNGGDESEGAAYGTAETDEQSGRPGWKSRAQGAAKGAGSGVKSAAGRASAGAGAAASAARRGASSAASTAGASARGAASGARAGGRRIARGARRGVTMSREGYEAGMEEFPLAMGGAALGLGLLCGLLVPETRREDEMLGPLRDDLVERGREAAEEAFDRGQEVVQATAESTQAKMREEGLSPDQVADKAQRVASEARQSAEEKAREEGLTPRELKEKSQRVAEEATETAKAETERQAKKSSR